MAYLKSGDIKKSASSGDYAGEERLDIFLLKIKDKKTFILGAAKGGKKVTGINFDKVSKILVYKEKNKKTEKSVSYTKVFKDPDFGGGAGSGGGADDTKYTESLQCYYCSYVFNKAKNSKVKSVSTADLESMKQHVDATKSLAECLNSGPIIWMDTGVYLKTANKLYEKFGRKVTGIVYFHRGSTFMNNVYKAKTACQNIDKESNNPQAPGSFSHDKWNPGDIWMTTFGKTDKPLADFTSSWGELNKKVAELAGVKTGNKTKLLGISLKKIGNVPARLREYKKPDIAVKKEYTYTGYKYGKTGDFFSSQDIYVETSADDIQFRTFSGNTSWQGEIKGSSAAAGKIGGGNVNFYTNQVMKKKFLPIQGEAILFAEAKQKDYPEKLYRMYKKHNDGQLKTKTLMDYSAFLNNFTTKNLNWRNSKIVCMKFLDVLEQASKKEQNVFINLLYLIINYIYHLIVAN